MTKLILLGYRTNVINAFTWVVIIQSLNSNTGTQKIKLNFFLHYIFHIKGNSCLINYGLIRLINISFY